MAPNYGMPMHTNQITIQIIGPDGVDEAVDLFQAYLRFYNREMDGDTCRSYMADRLAAGESVVYLAFLGESGQAVGFMQLYPTFSSVIFGRVWKLADLFVAPSARRLGVGERLIEAARQLAVDTEAKAVELLTAHDNLTAQALYEKTGFRMDSRFRRYFLDTRQL
jgi:ribosomal protein S18 acetylase RimI-like enzyme